MKISMFKAACLYLHPALRTYPITEWVFEPKNYGFGTSVLEEIQTNSAKFRENLIIIAAKFDEKCLQKTIFCRIFTNNAKKIDKFRWDFQFRLVQ